LIAATEFQQETGHPPDGAHEWSKRFGDVSNEAGSGVAADNGGNVLVTGFFEGDIDFGGGPLHTAGSQDIFVVKLAP
jgi:hypothetical protein